MRNVYRVLSFKRQNVLMIY